METNIIEVNHETLARDLEYFWKNFRPSPAVGIVGEPGIGKTEIVQNVARKLNLEYVYYNPVRRNPNTVTGIPFVKGEYAKWIPFETFKFLPEKTYVFHIDELTNAPPMIQASLLNVILERKAEDFTIPDNVHIVTSGNLSSHSKASFDFIEPLPSRLALYQLKPPTAEEWGIWAVQNGVHPLIITFIHLNPNLLLEKNGTVLYATPRGWARAGKFIRDELSLEDMGRIVSSFVGVNAGIAFRNWAVIRDQLPRCLEDALLLKDEKFLEALKEEKTDVIFYVITSLTKSEILTKRFNDVPKFIEALEPEFQIIAFRMFRTNEKWFTMVNTNKRIQDWAISKIKEWGATVR
jgi:hypothetical protein